MKKQYKIAIELNEDNREQGSIFLLVDKIKVAKIINDNFSLTNKVSVICVETVTFEQK